MDVKQIPELTEISYDPQNGLVLGAATPCYQIYDNQAITPNILGHYYEKVEADKEQTQAELLEEIGVLEKERDELVNDLGADGEGEETTEIDASGISYQPLMAAGLGYDIEAVQAHYDAQTVWSQENEGSYLEYLPPQPDPAGENVNITA